MDIYILFTCDIWKSNSSMRVAGVTINRSKLKKMIKKGILEGAFSYDGDDGNKGAKKFATDGRFENGNYDLLDYGYVMRAENGDCYL